MHSRSKSASKNKSRAYESANKTNEKIASVERITKTEHSSRKTKHISQITNDDNDNSKKKINNIKENSKKNDLESKKTKNIQGFREKTNLKKYQTCNEEKLKFILFSFFLYFFFFFLVKQMSKMH